MEHIVHSNVMQHYDVLGDNQHGFRKRRSCETRRPPNCLLMTAQSSRWSKTTTTDSSSRKTSQHWKSWKRHGRWVSTPLSALSSGSPLDVGKSSTLHTVSMATHLRWWTQVNTLESPSQKASPGQKHIGNITSKASRTLGFTWGNARHLSGKLHIKPWSAPNSTMPPPSGTHTS